MGYITQRSLPQSLFSDASDARAAAAAASGWILLLLVLLYGYPTTLFDKWKGFRYFVLFSGTHLERDAVVFENVYSAMEWVCERTKESCNADDMTTTNDRAAVRSKTVRWPLARQLNPCKQWKAAYGRCRLSHMLSCCASISAKFLADFEKGY